MFLFSYCNLVHRDTLLSEAIQLKNTYDREDMVSVSGRSHCGCLSFMRTREAKACHLSVTSQDDKEGVSLERAVDAIPQPLARCFQSRKAGENTHLPLTANVFLGLH